MLCINNRTCGPILHRTTLEASHHNAICLLSGRTPWRNGSASDSRSEGCVFKSRRGQYVVSSGSPRIATITVTILCSSLAILSSLLHVHFFKKLSFQEWSLDRWSRSLPPEAILSLLLTRIDGRSLAIHNIKGQMHHHDDLGSKCAYMCHLSNKTTRKSVLLSTPQIWLMKVSKKLA